MESIIESIIFQRPFVSPCLTDIRLETNDLVSLREELLPPQENDFFVSMPGHPLQLFFLSFFLRRASFARARSIFPLPREQAVVEISR